MPQYRHPTTGSTIVTSEEDFATTWEGQGFVLDTGEESPVGETEAPAATEATNLEDMSRDELNAHAESLGIADADKLPNKAAVVEAIEGAQPSAGTTGGAPQK